MALACERIRALPYFRAINWRAALTGIEQLKRKARLLLALQLLPLVPAGIAYTIALLGADRSNPITAWCIENWWSLLVLGGLGYVLTSVVLPWMILRCPSCKFRFSCAAITCLAFIGQNPAIKYCPHCGAALFDKVAQIKKT